MNRYRNEIRRMIIAINAIDGAYDLVAKKIVVKENTLVLLYALDDGKPHSQKEICEEWLIPKTTINTIIKECIQAGYIVLNTNSHRKEKEICLTERGQKYAQEVLYQIYQIEEYAIESVFNTGSEDFIEKLEQFTENLKREARRFIHES